MKRNEFIRECGPYEVRSISQGRHGVLLEIYPAYPQYNLTSKHQEDIDPSWVKEPRWAIQRQRGNGGGPSIFTAIALAEEFEEFLNQCYSEEEVKNWKSTLGIALKEVRSKATKQFEKAMKKAVKDE